MVVMAEAGAVMAEDRVVVIWRRKPVVALVEGGVVMI